MSNSPLASITMISPNKNSPRTHAIDRITIHCFVGQVTAKRGLEVFQPTSKQASCNYVVGKDGDIGLCVEEKDRSWCSSNAANDHRAITIETACDTTHPYTVTAKAYAALVDLCEDICRRNGKTKLIWLGDKAKTLAYTPAPGEMVMTVHCWFANKACPGKYLLDRHPEIAAEVTRRLGSDPAPAPTPDPGTSHLYRVRKAWTDSKSQIGAFKVLDNAKALADKNPGFAVFDETGEQVYPEAAPATPYRVQVTISDLYIRSEPRKGSAAKGFIAPGIYTIIEERPGDGSTSGWGKLKSGAGWIALDYARKL